MKRPLDAFPAQTTDTIRYADTDRQGHVNNACFATFLETGRVTILLDPDDPLTDAGTEFVVARIELDFAGEIHWPGTVKIGTGVARIGTSSITIGQVLYQDDRCVARAETVVVQVDTDARTSRPLTDAARARLDALRLDAL